MPSIHSNAMDLGKQQQNVALKVKDRFPMPEDGLKHGHETQGTKLPDLRK